MGNGFHYPSENVKTCRHMQARGASKIIGIDVNPDKFPLGREAGISEFINPKESDKAVHERVMEITERSGVEYSFECAGSIEALRESFLSTNSGVGVGVGVTVLFGVHASPQLLPIHPMELFQGRSITLFSEASNPKPNCLFSSPNASKVLSISTSSSITTFPSTISTKPCSCSTKARLSAAFSTSDHSIKLL